MSNEVRFFECVRMPHAVQQAGLLWTTDFPKLYKFKIGGTITYFAHEGFLCCLEVYSSLPHKSAAYSPTTMQWHLFVNVTGKVDSRFTYPRQGVPELFAEARPDVHRVLYHTYVEEPPEVDLNEFGAVHRHEDILTGRTIVTSKLDTVPGRLPKELFKAVLRKRELQACRSPRHAHVVKETVASMALVFYVALVYDAHFFPVKHIGFEWDDTTFAFFRALGWRWIVLANDESLLAPPSFHVHHSYALIDGDVDTELLDELEELVTYQRRRAIRALLELLCWHAHLGGHHDDLKPIPISAHECTADALAMLEIRSLPPAEPDEILGLAFAKIGACSSADEAHVAFAYCANLYLFPQHMQELFHALTLIRAKREYSPRGPTRILEVDGVHQGLYTLEELAQSYYRLSVVPPCINHILEWEKYRRRHCIPEVFTTAYNATVRHNLRSGCTDAALRRAVRAFDIISRCFRRPTRLERRREQSPIRILADAYETLHLRPSASDDSVIEAFNEANSKEPWRCEFHVAALRLVGFERHSMTLTCYWMYNFSWATTTSVRAEPSPEGQDENVVPPCGLDNIGNSFFLNPVLHFLYNVTDLRMRLISLAANPWYLRELPDGFLPTIRGHMVTRTEMTRCCRLIELLGDLFEQMYRTAAEYVTPPEELAFLALVPLEAEEIVSDYSQSVLDCIPPRTPPPSTAMTPENVALDEVEEYERMLHDVMVNEVITEHDTCDTINFLLSQVEMCLYAVDADGTDETVPDRLVTGTKIVKTSGTGGAESCELQPFREISVRITDNHMTVHDALTIYFETRVLCTEMRTEERTARIVDAPPILQVHFDRLEYDAENEEVFKNRMLLDIPENLSLLRHVDEDYVRDRSATHMCNDGCDERSSNPYEYCLLCIFVHRGETNEGQYYLYQRDLSAPPQYPWYMLEHKEVRQVDWKHVFSEYVPIRTAYSQQPHRRRALPPHVYPCRLDRQAVHLRPPGDASGRRWRPFHQRAGRRRRSRAD